MLNPKKELINNVIQNNIWLPPHPIPFQEVNFTSWISIKSYTYPNLSSNEFTSLPITPDELHSDTRLFRKVILDLTQEQKNIINIWLNAYFQMYNETIYYIRSYHTLDCDQIRNVLNRVIEDICYETNIGRDELNSAIKQAYDNAKFKSNLRYWNEKNNIQSMILQTYNFRNNNLGKLKGTYNDKSFNFGNVKYESRLIYNRINDEYTLYVPEKDENYTVPNDNIICLDPGVRTFLTGISEKRVIKIGDNFSKTIIKYLTKIDDINSRQEIPKKKKDKITERCTTKISNLVECLHWDVINYLTKNFKTIVIGNMETKPLTKEIKDTKIDDHNSKMEAIASLIKLPEFKKRLQVKCNIKGLHYKCTNESFTSKICSVCGYQKNDLGLTRVFECNNCKTIIDRDVNGARNIYIKAFLESNKCQ